MSWSYSGDPKASEKDLYRFLIKDTDIDQPILQDEEIQYLLETYPNKNERLYYMFDTASTLFARDVKRSLGPQSEDPTSRSEYFARKANEYKKLMTQSSGLSQPKSSPTIFTKGMHDNVRFS